MVTYNCSIHNLQLYTQPRVHLPAQVFYSHFRKFVTTLKMIWLLSEESGRQHLKCSGNVRTRSATQLRYVILMTELILIHFTLLFLYGINYKD
jgi:hypothetical protein